MRSIKRGFPTSDESVLWTNSTGSTVLVDSVITLLNGLGIAAVNIANGASGAVLVHGEFRLTKGTGYTLAQGQAWTWDGTKVVAWTLTSATQRGGVVVEAAATNDTGVVVRLEPLFSRTFAEKHLVTSGEAAANSTNGRVDFVTGFGVDPVGLSVMVLTSSTGVAKAGFVVSFPTAGTVRVDGVAAGVQVDAGDIICIIAHI